MRKILGVFAVLLMLTTVANAGLMLDLTAADGTKEVKLDVGSSGSFVLQLWGVVSGTDGNVNNEGIQSAYAWIKTTAGTAGGLTGILEQPTRPNVMNTAVNGGTLTAGDLLGSSKATTWCAKTSAGTATPPMTSLGGAAVPGAGEFRIIDANTVAFLLGNVTYNYAAATPGTASVNAVVPTWASSLNLAAVYGQDYNGTFQKVTAASQATVGTAVGITVVPEPATLVLLGMGALALVFIRRK